MCAVPTKSSRSQSQVPRAQVSILQIRPATPDDIPAFIELERACSTAAHWTADQYREAFGVEQGTRRLLWAAHSENGSLLGFLVAQKIASDWELENIVVAPAERGMGIGRRLLETLVDASRADGGRAIFLEVRESNHTARRLYERAGFRQTGVRQEYYSSPAERAILYHLQLQ